MKLTLNGAAKTCGKAKATILEAIRDGRLSAPKNKRGRYEIDPAELHRVFPYQSPDRSVEPILTPSTDQQNRSDLKALEHEVEMLRERLGDKDTVIEDLRRRLDEECEERRNLTRMLTASSEIVSGGSQKPLGGQEHSLGWFDRMLGRKTLKRN